MKEKQFVYTVEISETLRLTEILEMFRYSGDVVVSIMSDKPVKVRMRHTIRYEDPDHLKRSTQFFKGQILGRWGSFGCKISDVKEQKFLT